MDGGVMQARKYEILKVKFDLIAYHVVMSTIKRWKQLGERHYVTITNPHSVMLCQRDLQMQKATYEADMVMPDGVGIILAAHLLGYPNSGRVTGPELMLKLCNWGREHGYRHYFYGGAEGIAEKLKEKLCRKYPGLQVVGTCTPPFRPLMPQEDQEIVERINSTEPDILWVGLGAPKQEKWMAAHFGRVKAAAMIGVGVAFDYHSGNVRWTPPLMRRLGLEWAFRLGQNPRRMWRRNIDSPLFLSQVIWQRIKMTLGQGHIQGIEVTPAGREVQIKSVAAARPDKARQSMVLQADGSTLRLKVGIKKNKEIVNTDS